MTEWQPQPACNPLRATKHKPHSLNRTKTHTFTHSFPPDVHTQSAEEWVHSSLLTKVKNNHHRQECTHVRPHTQTVCNKLPGSCSQRGDVLLSTGREKPENLQTMSYFGVEKCRREETWRHRLNNALGLQLYVQNQVRDACFDATSTKLQVLSIQHSEFHVFNHWLELHPGGFM